MLARSVIAAGQEGFTKLTQLCWNNKLNSEAISSDWRLSTPFQIGPSFNRIKDTVYIPDPLSL